MGNGCLKEIIKAWLLYPFVGMTQSVTRFSYTSPMMRKLAGYLIAVHHPFGLRKPMTELVF